VSYTGVKGVVTTVTGVVLLAAYTVYAVVSGLVVSGDLRRVAIAMLVFIGVSVAAMVVVQIVFHVTFAVRTAIRQGSDKDIDRIMSQDMVEDEMTKSIAARAGRATAVGAGVGLVAALVLLAFGVAPALALHVLLWSFAVGSLVEGGLTVWYAQRGVDRA